MNDGTIPHLRVVVTVTLLIMLGFIGVTAYSLGYFEDQTTKGNIIGTWINLMMLAAGFWLGSSSGGKAKDKPADPVPVEVQQPPDQPVPVVQDE